MAAVHRYEGTVNQVMGDGSMALLGAPSAHEDHAVRRCAAPMASRCTSGSGSMPGAVVRSIGSDLCMGDTAVGQTTHVAACYDTLACVDASRRHDVTRLKPTSGSPFGDNSAPRGDQDHRCMSCHVNPGLGCGRGPSTPRTIHGDDVRHRLHIGRFEGITTRDVHAGPA
jgi:hypothetical protein